MKRFELIACLTLLVILPSWGWAAAQENERSDTYILTDEGWVEAEQKEDEQEGVRNPITGELRSLQADEAVVDQARRLLAADQARRALRVLSEWIDEPDAGISPFLSEAYRLRGDAYLALGRDFRSLFEYEYVIREFPASDQFLIALERQFDIATSYLGRTRDRGSVKPLKRHFWGGPRWVDATSTGEELLIRIQERVPGSRLSELAAITLADHYYERREMRLAAEMYRIFLKNFPRSELRRDALQRRVLSNVARYKGPEYDGAPLQDAALLIDELQNLFPAESRRSGITDALAVRVKEQRAQQQIEAARAYLARDDQPAACYTLRRLRTRFPTTNAAEDAFDLMLKVGCPMFAEELEQLEQLEQEPEE